jgi:hypothetical protein
MPILPRLFHLLSGRADRRVGSERPGKVLLTIFAVVLMAPVLHEE